MHMADALVSTPVALACGAAAAALIATAGYKLKTQNNEQRSNLIPLMGVMGAFIFAAQMVNFAIPGTGSSGHIIGGVLLAAVLGPWAAFITLTSVLIIQCLVFADGGLMALGCNILNMAAMSTLIAYPLIYRPIAGKNMNIWRMTVASIAACIVGLELGAVLVTAETKLSGITALSTSTFLSLMTGIHLIIGLVEGVATAAIIIFVAKARPQLLQISSSTYEGNVKGVAVSFLCAALITGGGIAMLASSDPDGLEWSIAKTTGSAELPTHNAFAQKADIVQRHTSIFPRYDNVLSGVIGVVMVLGVVWGVSSLATTKLKNKD